MKISKRVVLWQICLKNNFECCVFIYQWLLAYLHELYLARLDLILSILCKVIVLNKPNFNLKCRLQLLTKILEGMVKFLMPWSLTTKTSLRSTPMMVESPSNLLWIQRMKIKNLYLSSRPLIMVRGITLALIVTLGENSNRVLKKLLVNMKNIYSGIVRDNTYCNILSFNR